jgi:hypothetical protein
LPGEDFLRRSKFQKYYLVNTRFCGEGDNAMGFEVGPHLQETELEQYSMGALAEARLEIFEEHLLACASCQDRLLEMESYINAIRSVSPKLREARRPFWRDILRWPRPVWVGALALGALTLTIGIRVAAPPNRIELAAVTLQQSRGIEGLTAAAAPAGKPLLLNVDLTELPAAPSYRLQVVDAAGKTMSETAATARDGRIVQPMSKPLGAGQYYVRLYSPAGALLREFSLRCR